MLSYEVTIHVEDPSLTDALERYMVEKHIGEVFATGCFRDAHFEQSAPDVYRSRYTVATQEELDRYLNEHAARLRADFLQHFPGGMRITRSVWTTCTFRTLAD
jgi:hypothetical protein